MTVFNTGFTHLRNRHDLSLKEKWSELYKDKNFQARPRTLNRFASGFFWYIATTCFYFSMNAIGELYKEDSEKQLKVTVGLAIAVGEACLMWILTARKSTITYNPKNSPAENTGNQQETEGDSSKNRESWPLCVPCQHKSPPRSHHCKLCNICVLKCDHHCFFTSACIGFSNQKYFLPWLFWVFASSAFGCHLLSSYLETSYGVAALFIPVMPLYQVIVGDITGWDFVLYCHVYMLAAIAWGSLGFLTWQMYLIKRGQTTTEYYDNVIKYRQDVWKNYRSVFGPYWLFAFVVPLPFKQEGNGVDWDVKLQ